MDQEREGWGACSKCECPSCKSKSVEWNKWDGDHRCIACGYSSIGKDIEESWEAE